MIINCCAAVGSAARALAHVADAGVAGGDENLAASAEALASSNEELKESFMLMYEHRTISAKDMRLVADLGEETFEFAQRIDAYRAGVLDPMPDAEHFADECDALRWKGIELFLAIAKRTPEYAGPKARARVAK